MIRDTILVYEDYKDDLVLLESVRKGESYNDYLLRQAKIHMGVEELPTIPINLTSLVHALVDNGRWMWQCVACNIGVIVDVRKMSSTASPSLCPNCLYQGWIKVVVPKNRQEIEEELLKQPGFRLKTAFRNWEPSWDMDYLVRRTGRAQEQVESGVPNPRGASIGATRLWSVGEILTAGNKNTFERGPIRDLAGRNGPIGPYESSTILFNATTAQRNALAEEDGMVLYNSLTNTFEQYNGNWQGMLSSHTSQNFGTSGTLAINVVVTHGLGRVPVMFQIQFIALNSNNGYSAGEVVNVPFVESVAGTSAIFMHSINNLTYTILFEPGFTTGNTGFYITNKSSPDSRFKVHPSLSGDWAGRIVAIG